MDGGGTVGDRVVEEEDSGGKGEEEIGREGKEGGRFGEEERKGKDEEEEQNGSGVEGDEVIDGSAALDEGIGVGGDERLVEECNEKAEHEKVEGKLFEAEIGGEREWVKRLGGVGLWGFKEVTGGADEMVKTQREKRGGG